MVIPDSDSDDFVAGTSLPALQDQHSIPESAFLSSKKRAAPVASLVVSTPVHDPLSTQIRTETPLQKALMLIRFLATQVLRLYLHLSCYIKGYEAREQSAVCNRRFNYELQWCV